MHLIKLNQGFNRIITGIVDLASPEHYPLHIQFWDGRHRKQLEIIIKNQVPSNLVKAELINRARNGPKDGTYSSEVMDVVRAVLDDPFEAGGSTVPEGTT